jgi:hypothetical protein
MMELIREVLPAMGAAALIAFALVFEVRGAIAEDGASLELFDWKNEDGYAVATFAIMNFGDHDLVSSNLECTFFEPLLENVVPLPTAHGHTAIRAHQLRQFQVPIGAVGPYGTQLKCHLKDLIFAPEGPK